MSDRCIFQGFIWIIAKYPMARKENSAVGYALCKCIVWNKLFNMEKYTVCMVTNRIIISGISQLLWKRKWNTLAWIDSCIHTTRGYVTHAAQKYLRVDFNSVPNHHGSLCNQRCQESSPVCISLAPVIRQIAYRSSAAHQKRCSALPGTPATFIQDEDCIILSSLCTASLMAAFYFNI